MIDNNMVDAIVSSGANIVDRDFFEGLGLSITVAPFIWMIQITGTGHDRIYDTLIDEDQLRICDDTICQIANDLPARPYSHVNSLSKWANIRKARQEH